MIEISSSSTMMDKANGTSGRNENKSCAQVGEV